MRKLQGLVSNILNFFAEKRWTVPALSVFVILFILFAFGSKSVSVKLFYTDNKKAKLFCEKREITRTKTKIDKLNKIVDEVLLGPISGKYINLFSTDARIISSWIENNQYNLNLSKESVLDINLNFKNDDFIYFIAIQSIIFSVYSNEKSIKKIKFYFDGIEYKYIGNFNLLEDNFKFNWKNLKK